MGRTIFEPALFNIKKIGERIIVKAHPLIGPENHNGFIHGI